MATGIIENPLLAAGGVECVPLDVISSTRTVTLTFTANVRALLLIISGTPAQCGLYTVYGGYQSTTSSKALSASSVVTVTGHSAGTSGAGTMTIASTSALRGYLLIIEGNGGVTFNN